MLLLLVSSLGFVCLSSLVLYFYYLLCLKPERQREKLRKQGINGPTPSFLYGNIVDIKRLRSEMVMKKTGRRQMEHTYMADILPHIQKWGENYGTLFAYSMGNMVILHVTDPDLAREICQCKDTEFGRPLYLRKNRGALLGNSIISSAGDLWSHQRKTIAPEFLMGTVKGMVDMMVECSIKMLNAWESKVNNGAAGIADIRVDEELKNLSADIISRTIFGSNYVTGKEVFLKIRAIMDVLAKQTNLLGIPGVRYLPTKTNREAWRLNKEITSTLLELANHRKVKETEESDLLQVLINGSSGINGWIGLHKRTRFIVDNCKAMYFAGHETSSTAATFALLLLAYYPEWQTRVRAEINDICGGKLPDMDMLRKMKTLTMVIQETLRLYPTTPFLNREAFQDMKFKDYVIPKGINIWISIGELHQNCEIWGPDACEFNPERFASGIASACKMPHMYMPFGNGLRTCLGQNFAMVEMKIVLSLIVSKFRFTVSPNYEHNIVWRLVLEPVNGVSLQMERI
ncbi:hypothetical protein GIB67_041982 [Kingdonia uniflora]|uniref:Cytochrome P450 n=1 Tax=Kingdonia uniflora TaxID=39325 RepID=A0A7J7NZP3_9MAGN|nr:hypothetical protein GIB67_041982 [Kingdonia uniflora]